jgi:hypothetical protein
MTRYSPWAKNRPTLHALGFVCGCPGGMTTNVIVSGGSDAFAASIVSVSSSSSSRRISSFSRG